MLLVIRKSFASAKKSLLFTCSKWSCIEIIKKFLKFRNFSERTRNFAEETRNFAKTEVFL